MRAGAWDAIVVGGGHNGLVCAAYLGRAGLRTLLLERRPDVGGAVGTSELSPSTRVPTLAHTVGRLAPLVAHELRLAAHGLRLVQPAALVTSIGGEGDPITLWRDGDRTRAGLARHSTRDADAWDAFDDEVRALASIVWRVMLMAPPDPDRPHPDVLSDVLRLGWRYRRLADRHAGLLTRVLPQPVADWLEDRFETDALRALLAVRGLRYSSLGPLMAGTALHLLTDAAGNDGGAAGETVYARGGPGSLVAALAMAAREAGVTIRTRSEVVAIRDRDGTVEGVALADGEGIDAPVVVSGLDPRTTLLDLVEPEALGPELGWEAGNLRARGVTAKVNLALAELPRFVGLEGEEGRRRLRGRLVVAPSMAYLDRAADAARYGTASDAPWLEATIPSLVDPLLVDGAGGGDARHVMSVVAQSAAAPDADDKPASTGEALADRVMGVLERAAPGIGALVVAREIITPADLERDYGVAGGHPLHLEPGLDQWFAWRPLLGYARHRMPLEGLYLCGSGAHPGGGVTGLPGRAAARRILADLSAGPRPRRR